MSKSILKSVFIILTFASAYGQVKTLELPISNSNMHATLKASNGMLWVGTDEGLNLIYGKEKKVFFSNIEDSLSILNSDILKLSEGINKELIVLSKDGLSIFDSSSFSFSQIPLESEPKGVLLNPTDKTYWVFITVLAALAIWGTEKVLGQTTTILAPDGSVTVCQVYNGTIICV